jgi:hypothetical protein
MQIPAIFRGNDVAYSLHIERNNDPISLGEWRATVERIGGLRMSARDAELTNPRTRERITIPNRDGDVEVLLSSGEWIRAFSLSKSGSVTFRADLLSGPNERELARIVFAAARDLNARIIGDDGEEYSEEDFGVSGEDTPGGASGTGRVLRGPWDPKQ